MGLKSSDRRRLVNRIVIFSCMTFIPLSTTAFGNVGGVLFEEDFSDGIAQGFTVIDGNGPTRINDAIFAVIDEDGNFIYQQINNELDHGDPAPGLPATARTLGGYALLPGAYGSFVATLDVRADSPTPTLADAAITFGNQDNGNYYIVGFNNSNQFMQMLRVVDGHRSDIGPIFDLTGLGINPFAAFPRQFVRVKLTRLLSGTIELSLNGVPVYSDFDTTFGVGRFGIGAFNDAASFDNIVIRAVPEPHSLLLWMFAAFCLVIRAAIRRSVRG
jgi:hypothetical protein